MSTVYSTTPTAKEKREITAEVKRLAEILLPVNAPESMILGLALEARVNRFAAIHAAYTFWRSLPEGRRRRLTQSGVYLTLREQGWDSETARGEAFAVRHYRKGGERDE